jgi:hypothetical protein
MTPRKNANMALQVLVLELNEVNFEAVERYAAEGLMPNFRGFFEKHGSVQTTSEQNYDELEPWIQWVTAHTGLPLAEHGVFRLGDIVKTDLEQIWERLADHGVSVGAISPMNAKCRGDKWDFFVPDPWTRTGIVAEPVVKRMYDAIAQVVNDNAQERISPTSLIHLGIGSLLNAIPAHYSAYASYLLSARGQPWFKAILDQLLADLFIRSVAKHQTQFATLFLNAAAHIQHHYMFSSSVYAGEMRNPDWYVAAGKDPLRDVYAAYDRILGNVIQRFPNARIMLATGLHQDPHPEVTYYWRLKDHAAFLVKIGVECERVEPRMSRDFVIFCRDEAHGAQVAKILEAARANNGKAIFEVDNRGADLFVMLSYPDDVHALEHIVVNGKVILDFQKDVAFVAIKNGRHNGIGYFADSGADRGTLPKQFPLQEMPYRILDAFGLGDVDQKLAYAAA